MELAQASLDTWSLSSISGIIIVTLVLVEILKRIFQKNAGFGKIPVFAYSIGISVILSIIANKLLKQDDGTPMLPGHLITIIWKAIYASASASGFYSWLNNPESVGNAQPLGVSPPATGPLANTEEKGDGK